MVISDFTDLLKTKRTFQEGRRLIRIPNILLKKENSYKTIEELIVIIEMLIRYQKKFRWAPNNFKKYFTMKGKFNGGIGAKLKKFKWRRRF